MSSRKFQIPDSLRYESLESKMGDASCSSLSLEQQLHSLIGVHCPTNVVKYQILKKRDDLLCKLRVRNTNVNAAKVFKGNCPDMCPEKERYMRDIQKNLNKYECDLDGVMIHEQMVKDYSRSAADQEEPLPHELRPISVLQMTMNYLIMKIANDIPFSNADLAKWYDFLWSRTRSIRKDITQQMLSDKDAADLVEKCARFHIFASFRLSHLNESDFSQKMNTENLSKSFQTLRHMYDDMARDGKFCPNEAEFRSYDMILNLLDFNVHNQVLSYRKEIYTSKPVQLALELASAFQSSNYVRFFRLLKERASFLQACLCYRYFPAIRLSALKIMVHAYRMLPLDVIADALGYDDINDTQNFLSTFGLEIDSSDSNVELISSRSSVLQSHISDLPPSVETCKWICNKMNGCTLPEILYNQHLGYLQVTVPPPTNSFDELDRFCKIEQIASVSDQTDWSQQDYSLKTVGDQADWSKQNDSLKTVGDQADWSKQNDLLKTVGDQTNWPQQGYSLKTAGDQTDCSQPDDSLKTAGGQTNWSQPDGSLKTAGGQTNWSQPDGSLKTAGGQTNWFQPDHSLKTVGDQTDWSQPDDSLKTAGGQTNWFQPDHSLKTAGDQTYWPQQDESRRTVGDQTDLTQQNDSLKIVGDQTNWPQQNESLQTISKHFVNQFAVSAYEELSAATIETQLRPIAESAVREFRLSCIGRNVRKLWLKKFTNQWRKFRLIALKKVRDGYLRNKYFYKWRDFIHRRREKHFVDNFLIPTNTNGFGGDLYKITQKRKDTDSLCPESYFGIHRTFNDSLAKRLSADQLELKLRLIELKKVRDGYLRSKYFYKWRDFIHRQGEKRFVDKFLIPTNTSGFGGDLYKIAQKRKAKSVTSLFTAVSNHEHGVQGGSESDRENLCSTPINDFNIDISQSKRRRFLSYFKSYQFSPI